MSAFIATGGSTAPYPITNDGWFPDLDGTHMRDSLRLDGSITDARLEVAAVNAVIEVNRELADYQAQRQAEGHTALANVPAQQIQGESQLLHLYRRAIYCSAGAELAERIRDATLAIYRFASAFAAERGILIADTKLEFGLDADGTLRVMDEMLTPDSSRFWPADAYRVGGSPPSFDKQYVRDYLESLDWNKTAPGPHLPPELIAGVRSRYAEAYQRLTGQAI